MKIKNKKSILSFILGGIIFGSISVVSAYAFLASDISYTPKDTSWNVDNVKTALDDLHSAVDTTLLWTNENPTSAFGSQTINLDLSNYKLLMIETLSCFGSDLNDDKANAVNIVLVGYTGGLADGGSNDMRSVTTTSTSVTFGNAKYGQYDDNGCVIPYRIYGLKKNLYMIDK